MILTFKSIDYEENRLSYLHDVDDPRLLWTKCLYYSQNSYIEALNSTVMVLGWDFKR